MVQINAVNPLFQQDVKRLFGSAADLRDTSASVNGRRIETSAEEDSRESLTASGRDGRSSRPGGVAAQIAIGGDTQTELENGIQRPDIGATAPAERNRPKYFQVENKIRDQDDGRHPARLLVGSDPSTAVNLGVAQGAGLGAAIDLFV